MPIVSDDPKVKFALTLTPRLPLGSALRMHLFNTPLTHKIVLIVCFSFLELLTHLIRGCYPGHLKLPGHARPLELFPSERSLVPSSIDYFKCAICNGIKNRTAWNSVSPSRALKYLFVPPPSRALKYLFVTPPSRALISVCYSSISCS